MWLRRDQVRAMGGVIGTQTGGYQRRPVDVLLMPDGVQNSDGDTSNEPNQDRVMCSYGFSISDWLMRAGICVVQTNGSLSWCAGRSQVFGYC